MDMTSEAHDHSVDEDMVIANNNAYLMAMGEGSRIEIHAADAEKESWTNLEMTAEAGMSEITVQEETDWDVGDKIAIASTSTDWEEAEEFYVLEVSEDGKTITLGDENGEPAVLEYTHLGITQSYDNGQEGEDSLEMDVEVRAEVALLSRNVRIEGDADSVDDGFGGHTMVMDDAEMHISGAEFFHMGQEDILGRYPIHWHMLGDAEGQYVTNVSIHESYQKGSTIHGTSNILYEDNVIYDHVGHGVFFEDGSENNNQIYGNLVFSTQESETGEPIPTDGEHASSFWIENPNNAFIGNVAAGSESNGFWIFEGQLHGLSVDTYVGDSGQLDQLIFIGNSGHSTSGAGGAGGTDKILGIDGTINGELDFQQSTLAADFGVIEGFTAYNGAVWSLTHEMVFSDSAFIDVRFFARHENLIQDTVFDDGTVVLYRDGGNQYDNIYSVGGTNFQMLASDHVNTQNALNNFILEDGSRITFAGGLQSGSVDQQVAVDIDGALTGIEGGFITENDPFKASPGAVEVESVNGLVSAYTIGATEVTALGIEGTVRILRSDGESEDDLPESSDSRNQGDDNEDRSDANYEFHTTAGMPKDLAYLIDFEDVPEDLILNLANVRVGESVIYEVANVTDVGEVTGGVEVGSLDDLVESDVTAYIVVDDSLFIRIVADDVEVQEDRPVVDLLADYRAFGKIEITGLVEGDNDDAGARELSEELLTSIATMTEREEAEDPEIAEPAVDPNSSYIGYDLKMTEAQAGVTDTVAKASFELNYDVATRMVSISGEFSDLTSAATMVHLHGADGGVIGALAVDSADGLNGSFSGSVELEPDDVSDFLAGETYVNLHTLNNGPGELQGQVEVYAAGDFVLDRYESTSDTTVVTDGMARWSDESTWGDAGVPGVDDVVVIGPGQTVVLDDSALVQGIIVNGGELIVEDGEDLDIHLSTDYLLVIEGGLFQAGTEDDPLDTNFVLTLEGDDPDFDLEVGQHVHGHLDNTVFAAAIADGDDAGPIIADDDETGDDLDDDMSDDGDDEGYADDDMSDDGDADVDTPDDGETEEHADPDTSGDGESEDDEPKAMQDAAAFALQIVDVESNEALSEITEGSMLGNDAIGDETIAINVDPSMQVGSLAIRVGDYVKVMNAEPDESDDVFTISLPEGAVFEAGETVDIEVAAYAGPDATGDVLGEVGYSIDVPEEEANDDSDDFFLVEIFEAFFDFLSGLFGGGSGNSKAAEPVEFEQSETLLSELIPTIEFDENAAFIEEDDLEAADL